MSKVQTPNASKARGLATDFLQQMLYRKVLNPIQPALRDTGALAGDGADGNGEPVGATEK